MSYVFQMISVERGIEYTGLEKEAPWELEYRPPPFWPPNGRISFSSVNFRYNSDRPLVLRKLETCIYSREKVSLNHLPLILNTAKDLAPHLFLASLSLCQGDCLLLMDADYISDIVPESFWETDHGMGIPAFLSLCHQLLPGG